VCGEIPLKFSRRFVEDFDFLRGVHGDMLERLTGFGRWNEDAIFQVDGRLALEVIGMAWHEADFAADTHKQWMGRMNGPAVRAELASRMRRRRQDAGVVTALAVVLNPKAIPAGIRISSSSQRNVLGNGLLTEKFLEFLLRVGNT
jgi:hypothetical protein